MSGKTASGWWTTAGGLVGAVVGFIVLLTTGTSALGAIYGREYQNSSGVWGLSGLADLIFILASSPLYLVAFLISYTRFIKRTGNVGLASLYAVLTSVFIDVIVICIAWGVLGQGKVLKPG